MSSWMIFKPQGNTDLFLIIWMLGGMGGCWLEQPPLLLITPQESHWWDMDGDSTALAFPLMDWAQHSHTLKHISSLRLCITSMSPPPPPPTLITLTAGYINKQLLARGPSCLLCFQAPVPLGEPVHVLAWRIPVSNRFRKKHTIKYFKRCQS